MRRYVIAFVVLVGFAACNRGDNPTIEVDPGTTSSVPGSTTTLAGSPATTVAAGPATTPKEAADGLFQRWQQKDRAGASRYARQRAIDELFSHPDTGDVRYESQGCEPQGGQFNCAWTYPGGAMHMTVEAVAANAFVVDLVTYTAD
ncbi:MAG TPA: hypothetical protein VNB24_09225 [Acidimicrobiales bacterium]|nr:hypothetical protein [Acidimicrobiales bacterium]